MNSLAVYLTRFLIENSIVEEEMEEEYIYGFQRLVGKVINYTTLVGLALYSKALIPGIIFMVVFFSLRGRTGGYHAKTSVQCYLGTVIIYLVMSQVVVPTILGKVYVYIVVTVISGVTILLFAPVNHPKLLLDVQEVKMCKKSSRWLFLLISGCIWTAYALHAKQICLAYAVMGLGLDAALILIAKMVGQEVKEAEKSR